VVENLSRLITYWNGTFTLLESHETVVLNPRKMKVSKQILSCPVSWWTTHFTPTTSGSRSHRHTTMVTACS
jgi:hypothetical protein